MAWNPDTYNKFKSERFLPFYDLIRSLKIESGLAVIDLGCGTGELTQKLADLLPGATVLGVDSSAEMLRDSKPFEQAGLTFKCISIEEQLSQEQAWDVVFSNAAIQWVANHKVLLPKIISKIKMNGQLLIQIPAQPHNISNKLLNELADETPYHSHLKNWKRTSPVLDIDNYGQILFENGGNNIEVYEKIYPLVLKDTIALFDWVSGTALLPYLEKLPEGLHEDFSQAYKKSLSAHFQSAPVFYPFRRILMSASF